MLNTSHRAVAVQTAAAPAEVLWVVTFNEIIPGSRVVVGFLVRRLAVGAVRRTEALNRRTA